MDCDGSFFHLHFHIVSLVDVGDDWGRRGEDWVKDLLM